MKFLKLILMNLFLKWPKCPRCGYPAIIVGYNRFGGMKRLISQCCGYRFDFRFYRWPTDLKVLIAAAALVWLTYVLV